jgi:hypothetical protein
MDKEAQEEIVVACFIYKAKDLMSPRRDLSYPDV